VEHWVQLDRVRGDTGLAVVEVQSEVALGERSAAYAVEGAVECLGGFALCLEAALLLAAIRTPGRLPSGPALARR
jgi:hypothetical protein